MSISQQTSDSGPPRASASSSTAIEKTVWKVTLAYDGTDFHGWQVQLEGSASSCSLPTIQGTLAKAIATITGEQVLPQGSGRTDAGVHAAAQVASFTLATRIPAENFHRALNRALPASIRILAAEPVPANFHARHSALGKVYRYRIFHGGICSPFLARYVAAYHWPLDLAAMQEAARVVLGEHDFTSFAAHDPDRSTRLRAQDKKPSPESTHNHVRRVELSQWSCASPASIGELPGEAATPCTGGQIFTYMVGGNGFLHHMVRNLVGTFLEVGRGRIAPARVTEILEARNRALAGPTAPASGLCLMRVFYPEANAGRQ